MVPSKKYHVYYQTQKAFGEIVITQNHYQPITPDVLEDTKRIIRENNKIPEDEQIVICYWQRYEGEDENEQT